MHGLADNGQRYGHVVDVLVPAGMSVMACDLRGHGSSGGRRGHIERFDDYAQDITTMAAFAREQLPEPLMMVAHSMGGLAAVRMCQDKDLRVAGLVLSNPGLETKVAVPGWKVFAAKSLSRLLPTLAIPAGIPPEDISSDASEVRAYAEDPLSFTDGTARWGAEFMAAQDAAVASPASFRFGPTLVQLGAEDRIINPEASRRFFAASSSSDCRVETYEGGRHEIYNETPAIRDRAIADLRDFLLARTEAG